MSATLAVDWLHAEFARCLPFLAPAIERGGGAFDAEHVWTEIAAERAQLWPYANSAVVSKLETSPSGVKSLHWWLAGGDIDELLAMEPEITNWAKRQGCTLATIAGRRGWLRALAGYNEVYVVMAKEI